VTFWVYSEGISNTHIPGIYCNFRSRCICWDERTKKKIGQKSRSNQAEIGRAQIERKLFMVIFQFDLWNLLSKIIDGTLLEKNDNWRTRLSQSIRDCIGQHFPIPKPVSTVLVIHKWKIYSITSMDVGFATFHFVNRFQTDRPKVKNQNCRSLLV
jgi:hypothetical protein